METLEKPKLRRLARANQPTIPRFKSLNEFLEWMPQDSPFKYEWNKGNIERTDYMKFDERVLVNRLIRHFINTQAFQQGGMLFAEADVHLGPDTYRRPDAAFLTKNQISGSENGVKYAVPSFVIELISPNDRIKYLEDKLQEYFDAGVQVVWHIFPNTRQVWIYSDPLHHTVCSGSEVCSAAPALPDLEVTVEEMFRLP